MSLLGESMKLTDVSAKLLRSGQKTSLVLVDKASGETLETLRVLRAEARHKNYIISTWVKSYASVSRKTVHSHNGFYSEKVQEPYYMSGENDIAETRWGDCWVVTSEDGYTVYAWVCAAPCKLWHAYVVPEMRAIGILKEMVREFCGKEVQVARLPPFRKMPEGWTYNPYLLQPKHSAENKS